MRQNNSNIISYRLKCFWHYSALLICLLVALPANADTRQIIPTIPLFEADYEIRMNGLKVGKAHFSISKKGENTYLYKQRSKAKGIASWFRKERVTESSLWEIRNNHVRPIEYHYQKSGGDDDEEDNIRFDWKAGTAVNQSETNPWSIAIPDGTLDKLVVQVAMLLDIQKGETTLKYPIADNGRLKHYAFGILGEEITEVPAGKFDTIKLQRLDDDRDTT
ncbi:MAG: DUF3108 domain-containing protein, partial [Gammaproteobacteria bacterium]